MGFSFNYPHFHFKERKENILKDVEKRERELKEEWLTKSCGYQLVCNQDYKLSPENFSSSWAKKILKNLTLCIFFAGVPIFIYIYKKIKGINYLSTLKELSSIDKRKREMLEAKKYFENIEDNEKSFKESKEKELENWSEKIISYSLATLPYSQYEEQRTKKQDPYMKFLHIYAFCIALFLTGGLIIFYILYRKWKDPRYRFLESAVTKHVIEQTKFEYLLQDLIHKKHGFDILDNLSFCFSKTLGDISTESYLRTKFYLIPFWRAFFFFFLNLITLGLFQLWTSWLLTKKSFKTKKNFYKNWLLKKKKEKEIVTPLKLFRKKLLGKTCLYFKKVWIDWYFSTFISQINNMAITSNFFKPRAKVKNLNWSLMWMFTSPLTKWVINLILLLMTYTFLLVWSFSGGFVVSYWAFIPFVLCAVAFVILLGYHVALVI
ncbi:hypothetical protein [Mycoplasma parvum]|uniref:Uncharacterized protein n=1 Tax=Mycoplasma parvum str. Indiana TaxID=1403316 RepID=U5NCB2_9MOLU|nr:hypothetical protein [Mycoplasma parvum]AGX89062.1 hypothetical protein PRV_01525 [Mycoplasma parvum str. Indiana]